MSLVPAVRLRPVSPEDEACFQRWDEDEEVRYHYLGRLDAAAASAPSYVATPGRCVLRAVETGAGELIGWIGLHDILWRRRCGELRVCLGVKQLWGRGFGSAAVRVFLAQVFTHWRLEEVYLRVALWNRRAIRAYEKCGFRRIGILRAGQRQAEGLEDLLFMVVRREQLPAHRAG